MDKKRTLDPIWHEMDHAARRVPGRYGSIEIMMDYASGRIVTMDKLTPEWWIR